MRMHACYEEILEEKRRPSSLQTAVLNFLQSISGTFASPPVLLDIADDDPHDLPTVKGKCFLLLYSFVCNFTFFFF